MMCCYLSVQFQGQRVKVCPDTHINNTGNVRVT